MAAIKAACQELFKVEIEPELTRPEEQFGDYATNVALKLGKQLGSNPSLPPSPRLRRSGKLRAAGNPRELAAQIAEHLKSVKGSSFHITKVEVAGPGFINLTLSDGSLGVAAERAPEYRPNAYKNQVVVAEYSDPSSFKVLHAGHLYTSVVGDAIASLLEAAGGAVHRVNFGGDVGRHVAITMWAIVRELGGEHPEKLADVPTDQRADWMSARYVEGNTAFEDDDQVKAEVVELNKRVYQLHADGDHGSPFAHMYWTCRQWSYDYFDQFYARIGSHFEKYYPESETMQLGLQVIREQLAKGVYEKSDGAVVFKGEPYGLHTRVFINSQGLPTYETKDVGLIMKKWDDYHYDSSVIMTDNAQEQYLAVVLKSIEQFAPKLALTTRHLTHGRVKLAGGVKMSSRKGNIIRAVDVLDIAAEANKAANGKDNEATALAAVKYAFLKQRIGGDIIYDPAESVSLQGNSGPYLQYAHARARSILSKSSRHPQLDWGSSKNEDSSLSDRIPDQVGNDKLLEKTERSLVRKIGEYPEVVEQAVSELMPHHICTYLYELAQTFNSFYEHNRVLGDPREILRLQLVTLYADTLQAGLTLLNIPAPERM